MRRVSLQKEVGPLLEKAKELEKRYNWLDAVDFYEQAYSLVSKDFLKAAELQERIGFCFIKAADQAETNKEFRKHMKQAVQAYRKESKLLEKTIVEDKQVRIDHVTALIALVEGVLEKNLLEKKKLLDKWWSLENQVISAHEKCGDLSSAGKMCNDLLEYSRSHRFWLVSSHSEWEKNNKEYLNLAEKAIQIFSQLNDDFELARAYFLATYYYYFSRSLGHAEKIEPTNQKAQEYTKKALELSHKTGDPWLIGESYRSSMQLDQTIKDSTLAIERYKKAIKYGKIAKSNYVITGGTERMAHLLSIQANVSEDPDKQKENLRNAIKLFRDAERRAEITENVSYFWHILRDSSRAVNNLASIETDPKTKQELLEMATDGIQKGRERLHGWKMLSGILLASMSKSLQLISKNKSEIEEKRKLLKRSKHYLEESLIFQKEMRPLQYFLPAIYCFLLAQICNDLATIETDDKLKIKQLKCGVKAIEKSIKIAEKVGTHPAWSLNVFFRKYAGMFYDLLGGLLVEINVISKEENTLFKAIDSYQKATLNYEKADFPTHMAESYWHLAQLYDKTGKLEEASQNYESASKAYNLASKKIPQLKEFCDNYSSYMLAWSQIEKARQSHSIEDYEESQQHYEKAAKLHQVTNSWSYLAPNYFAWSNMEEAEGLSRKENAQQAKQAFQKALEFFSAAKQTFKQKLAELTSLDEKEMIQRLFEASVLRQKYCQARILLEEAKLLDRDGKHLQSSTKYREAAQNISIIVNKMDIEAERKELEYLAVLCQAWQKMANAEETSSSEAYLEAAELFEKAKEYCFTKKASLWALGNSSFCKGLAAGIEYQSSADLREHSKAKSLLKSAANSYLQAGFKTASEYAKATQRLFDAYLSMNQAEIESDQEKRAKHYQMAESLLQIAAGSFIKAKQPEKQAQIQDILTNVREEKALAVSLSQVMQAPIIASSTLSFAAPTPTSESSVGLETFEHANVQANLVTQGKEVKVGESFCLSVEFVNAGREPALLLRVDDFVPSDFVVVKKPEIYRIEETCLNMKGKQIAPLKLVEVMLTLQASKKGQYHLNPRVQYLNELGQIKSLQLKTLEIEVEEIILEDRVTTGTKELDSLLLGGIPNEYAVVLSGPPCDEREMIINNFLESGVEDGISFYITIEVSNLQDLLENPNFVLFLCNPKPKVKVPNLPNVFKLQGKTDLNNLGIALTKAYRSIDQSVTHKRICIEILSEILEDYGSKTTRKWISDLITNYGTKGFTMLAVMNPAMHPSDQATAVIDLFDGEISITQSDDPLDCKKSIHVKKLRNQDYIKNPICLR